MRPHGCVLFLASLLLGCGSTSTTGPAGPGADDRGDPPPRDPVRSALASDGVDIKPAKNAADQDVLDVNLTGRGVKDDTLTSVAKLDGVLRLNLKDNRRITDQGLARLKGARIESLDLSGTRIGDEGLEAIQNLNSLEALDLSRTAVTDEGLRRLAGLTRLKRLNLSRTKINGEGLSALGALKDLESLNLSSAPLNDVYVAHVRQFPKLKEVDIRFTQVTDAGHEWLLNVMPRTKIER
jgi:Leucine-rich repeat (LRR) protein